MRPDVARWLTRARADAEARGLPALGPLLDTLARSTQALRDADITAAGPEGPAYTSPDNPDAAGPGDPGQAPDASDAAE